MVGGWWLVVGGWWLVVGWLVVGGWWVVGGVVLAVVGGGGVVWGGVGGATKVQALHCRQSCRWLPRRWFAQVGAPHIIDTVLHT